METPEKIVEEFKQKYLDEVIGQSPFSFIKYFGRTTYSQQGKSLPEVSFFPPESNGSLKKSPYFLSNEGSFIHYTSLRNAINIFNDGFLRLNSLAYMDDPQEMIFAGNKILDDYNAEEIKKLKQKIFCISFCGYEKNSKPDNFDAWRLYGDNGLGVGIVFKFSSDPSLRNKNYMSKIHYGEEITEKFKIFKDLHDKFILESQDKVLLMSNTYGKSGKLPEWIALFLSFHKSSLYKIEDEIRFLKYDDCYNANSFTLNHKFERTFYDKLLIKTRSNLEQIELENKFLISNVPTNIHNNNWIKEVTQSSPIIEIAKIIIGYRQKKNFQQLSKVIKEGFLEKNRVSIDVELSDISKSFWGL